MTIISLMSSVTKMSFKSNNNSNNNKNNNNNIKNNNDNITYSEKLTCLCVPMGMWSGMHVCAYVLTSAYVYVCACACVGTYAGASMGKCCSRWSDSEYCYKRHFNITSVTPTQYRMHVLHYTLYTVHCTLYSVHDISSSRRVHGFYFNSALYRS